MHLLISGNVVSTEAVLLSSCWCLFIHVAAAGYMRTVGIPAVAGGPGCCSRGQSVCG